MVTDQDMRCLIDNCTNIAPYGFFCKQHREEKFRDLDVMRGEKLMWFVVVCAVAAVILAVKAYF